MVELEGRRAGVLGLFGNLFVKACFSYGSSLV